MGGFDFRFIQKQTGDSPIIEPKKETVYDIIKRQCLDSISYWEGLKNSNSNLFSKEEIEEWIKRYKEMLNDVESNKTLLM